MPKDIATHELEALVTTRVLCDRMRDPRNLGFLIAYPYADIQQQSIFALDDILVEHDLNTELWARRRGKRVYLFYLPSNRIAAEVGIITDRDGYGRHTRFRMELFGYKGRALPETLADLVIEQLERDHKQERKNYYGNYQSKTQFRR